MTPFHWTIAGLPCRIRVDRYLPGTPDGRWEPGDPEECEFTVLDHRGKRENKWLTSRLDDADREAVVDEVRRRHERDVMDDRATEREYD